MNYPCYHVYLLTNSAVGPSTPTCRNCIGGNCANNLLPEVLKQGLLTSGYLNLISSVKPAGNLKESSTFMLCSTISISWTYPGNKYSKYNKYSLCSKVNAATGIFLTRQANRTQRGASIRMVLGLVMAPFTTKQPIWLWLPLWSYWRTSE